MLVLVLAATLASTAACTEPLEGAERRWVAALETGDRAALADLLDDGFSDFNWRGDVRDKPQVLAGLAPRGAGAIVLRDVQVMASGRLGVVRGLTATRTGAGEARAARFTDIFICRAGRWRAVSAQETPVLGPP